jgi:hypothetical protein
MNTNTASKLAKAVHVWLTFQSLCDRNMLMSESYLTQPIGEFLRANHSGGIKPEWPHPTLQRLGCDRPAIVGAEDSTKLMTRSNPETRRCRHVGTLLHC